MFCDIRPCSADAGGRHVHSAAFDADRIGGYAVSMSLLVDWNGKDLPDELKELPAGRYVVETVDDFPALSPAEEEGLLVALASLRRGDGVPEAGALSALEARLRR